MTKIEHIVYKIKRFKNRNILEEFCLEFPLEFRSENPLTSFNICFHLIHRNVLGNHLEIPEKLGIKVEKHISMKDYIPYVNRFADLPTILEAYQYLMKRYVTNAKERKRKWIKAKNTSAAILAFKKAQSSKARTLKAQFSKELKFMEPDQNHPDQQHHKKNIAGYLFSLCHKISYFLLQPIHSTFATFKISHFHLSGSEKYFETRPSHFKLNLRCNSE